jgi:hypothetical protein
MAPKPPTPEQMVRTVEEKSGGGWELLDSTLKGENHSYHCECRTHGPFSSSWSSLRLGPGYRQSGKARQIESVSNYSRLALDLWLIYCESLEPGLILPRSEVSSGQIYSAADCLTVARRERNKIMFYSFATAKN